MWRLTVHCCDSHRLVCADKKAGFNGVGFSMDIRLLGPKGMNGLKQHQTTSSDQLAHHAPAQLPPPVDTTWESSHNPPSEQTHPHNSRYTPRCPSVVLWPPPRCGVGCVRTDHQGLEKRLNGSLRTWRWRVRRSPCPSSPTTHPPYVPRPSALDQTILTETC
jgi:hypothetical protein